MSERFKCVAAGQGNAGDVLDGGYGRLPGALPCGIDRSMAGNGQQPGCERFATAPVAPDPFDGFEEDLGSDIFGEGAVAQLSERGAKDESVVLFEKFGPGGGIPPCRPALPGPD